MSDVAREAAMCSQEAKQQEAEEKPKFKLSTLYDLARSMEKEKRKKKHY